MQPLRTLAPLACAATLAACCRAGAPQFQFETTYESRYFAQGRPVAEGTGLITGSLGMEAGPLVGGTWQGVVHESHYSENDTFIGCSHHFRQGGVEMGYNRIQIWAPGDDETQHEFYIDVTADLGPVTHAEVNWVWSKTLGGSFLEASLARDLPAPQWMEWDVHATLAWDFGYTSHPYDGLSHALLGTRVAFHLTGHWSIEAWYDSIVAFHDIKRDGGSSLGHAGTGLLCSF